MGAIDLLGDNPNISITIKASELQKVFATLVDGAIAKYRREIEPNPDDILYSIKQVCEMLSVDKSTLWRWQQRGYLVPTKVGDLPRYRKSQIDELLGKKSGGAE
ncbi:MAG: helix-turn-helix domain-containing protein [Rikenellaceae bacterium]